MVLDIGTHSSLRPNPHHEIVFAKYDSKVFILHYTEGMSAIINMQILFRSKMYLHLSTDNKHFLIVLSIRIFFVNETIIINVMSHYIPYEANVFDDQNLPYMNVEIENLVTTKKEVLKNI